MNPNIYGTKGSGLHNLQDGIIMIKNIDKAWGIILNKHVHFMRLLTQYTTINKSLNALTAQIRLRSSPVQGIDKVRTRPLGNAARNTGNKAGQTGFFLEKGSEQRHYKATSKLILSIHLL